MTKPRRRQAGEGGISQYETKSGPRYLIKYTLPIEDGSSKTVLKRGFPTRKAAAEALGEVNSEIRRGVHVTPSKLTTAQWLDTWLSGRRLAPSTRASYAKNLRVHVLPAIGSIPLAKLTGTRLSSLYRELEEGGRRDHRAGEGLSARTVRYIATILKSALKDAVSQGLLAVNPADRATPPAAREARAPEMHAWSSDELSAFLVWADGADHPDAVAWRMLAFTGMRRGELLALRWRDVDLEHGRLSVRRTVGLVKARGEGTKLIEGQTKTGRDRVVDLDPGTVEVLRQHRVARGGLALDLVRDPALVFGDIQGEFLDPDRFSRRFVRQVERRNSEEPAAIPGIRLHDLRHTHATLLLRAGVPPKVVSERLGHATVMITLQTYQHVLPGMQAEAAAKFASIVGRA